MAKWRVRYETLGGYGQTITLEASSMKQAMKPQRVEAAVRDFYRDCYIDSYMWDRIRPRRILHAKKPR